MEKMLVRGVTRDNDVARIALCGVEDTPGKAFSVFRMLAKHGISVDLIIQSIGNGEKKDITYCYGRSYSLYLTFLKKTRQSLRLTKLNG